jgi:hypothetical protein
VQAAGPRPPWPPPFVPQAPTGARSLFGPTQSRDEERLLHFWREVKSKFEDLRCLREVLESGSSRAGWSRGRGLTPRAAMASTGLIEVAPGIFVEGTPDDGCQDALLKRAGITHLVEAAGATAALEDNGAASSVERLAFPILGLRGESFVEAFKESTAFINRAVDSGGRVLVQGTIEEWEERAQQQWRRRELRGLEGRTIAVVAASRAARGQALGVDLYLVLLG